MCELVLSEFGMWWMSQCSIVIDRMSNFFAGSAKVRPHQAKQLCQTDEYICILILLIRCYDNTNHERH